MNSTKLLFIFILLPCFIFRLLPGYQKDGYQYVSPKPGSVYASPSSTIIIRSEKIMPRDLTNLNSFIEITGTINGQYIGRTIVSTDNKTIIYKPLTGFIPGETVYVSLSPKLSSANNTIQPNQYQFTVSTTNVNILKARENIYSIKKTGSAEMPTVGQAMIMPNGVSVPNDFPTINVNQAGATADGKLFFASAQSMINDFLIILNNDGTPYFYHRFGKHDIGIADFRVHENGLLSYFTYKHYAHFILNQHYEYIDTFYCAHGYPNNNHEFLMIDGHTILIANHTEIVDMSEYVEGGDPAAYVRGMDIQEFDEDENLIFEWSTWDHLDILDALHTNLTLPDVDLVHLNSVAVDYDDHLIVSFRNHDQVIKINRQSGDIIWRLGGVKNEFTFINDPDPFTYQHDARPVPGNPDHYTIFDNGTYRNNPVARGVEYLIDTLTMTAENVWEYNPTPDIYSIMMGSLQVLPNGNRLIDWSVWAPIYTTEVSYGGDLLYELTVDEFSTYRTRRYMWEGMLLKPYLIVDEVGNDVNLIFNKFGDPDVDFYRIYGSTSPNPTALYDTSNTTMKALTDIDINQTYYFRVTAVNSHGGESDLSNEEIVYKNAIPGHNMILNGDFSNGIIDPWIWAINYFCTVTYSIEDGVLTFNIVYSGSYIYDTQLRQDKIKLVSGRNYNLEFDARADGARIIEVKVGQGHDPWIDYSQLGYTYITETNQHFSRNFTMNYTTDNNARIEINAGMTNENVYIDNVSLKEIVENHAGDKLETTPHEYQLKGNYPNPFNMQTSICFSLGAESRVIIRLYNLLGQFVKEITHDTFQKGKHHVSFNSGSISSGIYFYSLEAVDMNGTVSFRDVKKMVIIK